LGTTGGRYTTEFKTKAALTEWANNQTMAEIAACYNGLPGVKPVKKFESRDVAVTRIWASLSPEPADKPKMARKLKAARKAATSGRKRPKTSKPSKASKAGATVRDEAVKLFVAWRRRYFTGVDEDLQVASPFGEGLHQLLNFEAWLQDRVVQVRRRSDIQDLVIATSFECP
jgi:hypothetical protein